MTKEPEKNMGKNQIKSMKNHLSKPFFKQIPMQLFIGTVLRQKYQIIRHVKVMGVIKSDFNVEKKK